ncbi:MAG: Polyketide synthase [Firmicutes bacterium]|nr:Polyketide synthase [Bacillota bacterium]
MAVAKNEKESIAIVGVGCRFPGGSADPEKYWNFLCSGGDGIVELSSRWWEPRQYYSSESDRPGKYYVKKAGLLQEDVRDFDPLFFGISPREAVYLDPQQRLLLEVSWEALEDAGLSRENLSGSRTGVFIGGFAQDHMATVYDSTATEEICNYSATGTGMTMLAAKLSYVYNLTGPAVALDTACSSSLVAVHYACQSIWQGESSMAITGGVNAILRPELFVSMCKGKFLSPQNRCAAFDRSAAGYVRGEGAGLIVLKPLSQAIADGDRVYAVIMATGVNQDGQTEGITVPNSSAQAALIKEVYEKASIDPSEIGYIEAHGTGTQAGDLAEATALNQVLSPGRMPDEKCLVGAVKTNIGHLEAAAGVASLIKAILCVKHRRIPPNLHFQNPNPNITFDKMCIRIPTSMEDWPAGKPYAGINSFGYGGTNAHIVLSHAPERELNRNQSKNAVPHVIPLSAHCEAALAQLAKRYYDYFTAHEAGKQAEWADIIHTLVRRRSHHYHRLAIIASNREQFCENLKSFANHAESSDWLNGSVLPADQRKIVFVCSGMGPQWWAMGRELMSAEPIFRRAALACDAIFKQYAGWSIVEEMLKPEAVSRMSETSIAQPANFVIQVALAAVWQAWGIVPDAVVGHSVGEVAAAYLSGALSLADALLVVYHRSRLQQTVAGQGGMLAVELPEEELTSLLVSYDDVDVAAVNSLTAATLASSEQSLQEIAALFAGTDVFHRRLKVEVAYHSRQMEPLQAELLASLAGIKPEQTKLPLYSTVTGEIIEGQELCGSYWWRNVRQTVRFAKACHSLARDGYTVFLEVGPHPVLAGSINDCLRQTGITGYILSSLRRDSGELAFMRHVLGRLYTLGYLINWSQLVSAANFISLPPYPWQREPYWPGEKFSKAGILPGHIFLSRADGALNSWQVELNNEFFPYLSDHLIYGTPVFPGSGYIEAGLALQERIFGEKYCVLENLDFKQLFTLYERQKQVLFCQYDERRREYQVYSQTGQEKPVLHATGKILPPPVAIPVPLDLAAIRLRCCQEVDIEEFYRRFAENGLIYKSWFKRLTGIYCGQGEVLAEVAAVLPQNIAGDGYILHPAMLDACIQSLLAIAPADSSKPELFVPVAIEQVAVYGTVGEKVWCHGVVTGRFADTVRCELQLCDATGSVLVRIKGLVCRSLRNSYQAAGEEDWFYQWSWQSSVFSPQDREAYRDKPQSKWLIISDAGTEWSREAQSCWESSRVSCIFETVTPERCHEPELFSQVAARMEEEAVSSVLYALNLDWQVKENDETTAEEAVLRCTNLTAFVQAVADTYSDKSWELVLVTRDCQQVLSGDTSSNLAAAPLWGLGVLIGNEYPTICCRQIDLDVQGGNEEFAMLLAECLADNRETALAFRGGERYCRQLARLSREFFSQQEDVVLQSTKLPVSLQFRETGSIDNLHYREVNLPELQPGEVLMQVDYGGLNHKDLLKTMGIISYRALEDTFFGQDFVMDAAGKIIAVGPEVCGLQVGDEVLGVVRGICSLVNVAADYLIVKPEGLSLSEGAALTAYGTAYHALVNIARLQRGEKVLIHNAAGGVGMAAVELAKWLGAEIYATAGLEEKREYLRACGIRHVMDSRTLQFAEDIMTATSGRGVDVILNATSGETLYKTLSLLAPFGRFVEIGKKDIIENNGLPMAKFNQSISFTSLDMDLITKERPQIIREIYKELAALFASGCIKPIPVQCFPAEDVKQAFQLMAASRHIGKIALDFRDRQVLVTKPWEPFKKSAAYLITGGTQGLGLEIASWLAANGAGCLVLVSRRGGGPETWRVKAEIEKQYNVQVTVAAVDVSDYGQVGRLMEQIHRECPPLRGVFHCAMVLDDGLLQDMNESRYRKVMEPKVKGALHLHQWTRQLNLDMFVMFSSVASLIGNSGQANYVAANAFLDAFAHYRQAAGLPGVTLNLGPLMETGVAAHNQYLAKTFAEVGVQGLKTKEVLAALEQALKSGSPQTGFFKLDWQRWAETSPSGKLSLFKQLTQNITSITNGGSRKEMADSLMTLSPAEKRAAVEALFCQSISRVLKIPVNQMQLDKSIVEMGLDSLTAVELEYAISHECGVRIPVTNFLKKITISQAVDIILKELLPQGAAGTGEGSTRDA